MKKLKHIQIFEAFESNKLSKTLGYIESQRDKSNFLDHIKRICNIIDFPYSELSDEYFDYLPFNSALKKADIITDEPCTVPSSESYPEYAVGGEICKEGKVKRKWGRQIRSVVCPVCNGTGVKPKTVEPKLVKFWFNKDGKYITNTCVDGIIRGNKSFSNVSLPQNASAYTVSGDRINSNDRNSNSVVQAFATGQYVHISIDGREMYAYILSERGSRVFALQPYMDGGIPNAREWQAIARRSWNIAGIEFDWIVPVSLNNVDEDDAEPEVDPYSWNTGVDFTHRGIRATGRNIENSVKEAHFAIIMDFGKLKKSEFVTRNTTKINRGESKKDALAFRSNDDIKRENIQRYITTLSNKLKFGGTNVADLSNVIKRLLGYKNTIFNLRQGTINNDINSILNGYISLLSSADANKERYLNELNNNIKYAFEQSMERNENISKNLQDCKERLKSDGKEDHSNLLSTLDELSLVIYEKITNFELETIEDLEILHQKVLSMKNLVKSNRYHLSDLSYFMDFLSRNVSDYAYTYLTDRYYVDSDKATKIEEGIKTIIRIIKKM
jgi:hypothetical protein